MAWVPDGRAASPRTKTKRRRTTTKLRDNQGYRRLVAQRQSNSNLVLATDNHTEHHPIVAVTNPHLDCRALSSRSSRDKNSTSISSSTITPPISTPRSGPGSHVVRVGTSTSHRPMLLGSTRSNASSH